VGETIKTKRWWMLAVRVLEKVMVMVMMDLTVSARKRATVK
jgi:hypothetical protein